MESFKIKKTLKGDKPFGITEIEREKYVLINARRTCCPLFSMTAAVRAPSCFSGPRLQSLRTRGCFRHEASLRPC